MIQVQLVKFRDGEAIWHPSAPWPLCLHCIHVGDFRVFAQIYFASDFGFSPLIANATSISRRIASGLPGWSG